MPTDARARMESYGQPSPVYFVGAMLADGVDPDLATKVADGYAEALDTLQPEQLLQWRMAVLAKLDAGVRTVFAILTHPSEHEAPNYLALAATYRRKETLRGDTPQPLH